MPNPSQESAQELARLRQRVAELEQQQQAQASSQQEQADQQARQIEALRQSAAAVAQRGRAIEENRLARVAWYGEAGAALGNADLIMMGGSFAVGPLVESARALLERAGGDAAGFSSAQEASNARGALAALQGVEYALAQSDLANARVALLSAVQYTVAARSLARSAPHPLYAPPPP
ncbi:MAG: hypothetical protein HY901_23170 [Deltaproteobacteria bacterium]|nr:hypothetical protein [Deltaproteobacteria bacterium]